MPSLILRATIRTKTLVAMKILLSPSLAVKWPENIVQNRASAGSRDSSTNLLNDAWEDTQQNMRNISLLYANSCQVLMTQRFNDDDITISGEFGVEDIDKHLGFLVSNVTLGRHVGKDFLAGLRNLFGGRSSSWEKSLEQAQQESISELIREAKEMDADALINLTIESERMGAQGGMINIKATGTAVKIKT